jgi:predicted RNA-binding protein with PUA-like domain
MAMKLGELGFFYHSSCEVPGVAGICEIVREAYPDHTQFDPSSKYFDPKASEEKPRWFMPDVRFVEKFADVVPLSVIRHTPGLQEMQLVTFGRLSVTGVSDKEWEIILAMAERSPDPTASAPPSELFQRATEALAAASEAVHTATEAVRAASEALREEPR